MKQALKRIEEALNQLETRKNAANPQREPAKRSYSFDLHKPPNSDFPQPQVGDSSTQTKQALLAPKLPYFNVLGNYCPPAEETNLEVSSLPENLTEDSDDRRRAGGAGGAGEVEENSSGCAFAPDTLPPVGGGVSSSLRDTNSKFKIQNSLTSSPQKAIEQVVHQIQDLYHQGPIVDGYLEYYPPAPEQSDSTLLREVCFERVIDNLEEVNSLTSGQEISELPGASYRLCGVDASGQHWSYPCPLDQLTSVSMAIARYQKLQQLLQQKYELEQVAGD